MCRKGFKLKVLVIGATGMLGYSIFANLIEQATLDVFGTVRSIDGKERYFANSQDKLIYGVDVTNIESIESAIAEINPEVVINCIGLIKQHSISKQHIDAININSLLPHQLAHICSRFNAKFIHFSTDCVFDGKDGNYSEDDLPTARDLYGKSKCLGEIDYTPHLTLRTSIIGHELTSNVSLVDWFLSQEGKVKGFSKAIFSGLPTCVISKLLIDKILPFKELAGLYHLSVNPIDKFTLLNLVKVAYGKNILIEESQDLAINRSLDSARLKSEINFHVPSWPELVDQMHFDYKKRYKGLK